MKRMIRALLVTSFVLLSVSCRWDIWSSSVIDYGKGTGTITTKLNFTGEAPKYASATKALYSDRIVVTWNKVNGADFYEIYRKMDDSTSTWTKLTENTVDTTIYEDTSVKAGVTYMYKVRARSFSSLSILGNYSETVYGTVLTPPLSFTASQGDDIKAIKLTWTKVDNVKGYKIYWSTTGYGGTWSQVIPADLQVYDYTYSSNVTEATYVPAKADRGAYIYFYIVSISETGVESSKSIQRTGYTRVEGAPPAAKNFTAGRGTSKDAITLTWDAMYPGNDETKSYDWDIYRSAEGESEVRIYSYASGNIKGRDKGDPQPSLNAEGMMTITDTTALKEGVEYTYKIIAIGSVTEDDGTKITANGSPATASGFLLSPPMEIKSKELTDTGFRFVFTNALGGDENPSWSYTVYGRKGENDEWHEIEGYESIPVTAEGEYTIETTYDVKAESGSGSYEYFSVRTNAGYNSSRSYADAVDRSGFYVPRPTTPDGFNATDNAVYSGDSAENGFYPVSITLSSDTTAVSYDVRVWWTEVSDTSATYDDEFRDITAQKLDNNTNILKLNSRTPIGTKYYYAVKGKDRLGREGGWSNVNSGYSAITGSLLIKYMQMYCLKPWEYIDTKYLTSEYPYPDRNINQKWKDSAIYGKIKQAGTGSLTDGITESSYFNGGTIKYSAVVQGLGGRVSFAYNKFGEVEWMSNTGSYTMNVSASGSGDATGGFTIRGWYPASIGMTNISVSNQKFVGTYTVTQSNGLGTEEVSPDQE